MVATLRDRRHPWLLAAGFAALFACSGQQEPGGLFFDDFDGERRTAPGVTVERSGVYRLEGVAGFADVGFGGRFLRNDATGIPAPATTWTLTGLPEHEAVEVGFLLALIDTWDGSPGPARVAAGGSVDSTHAPDFLTVTVDGAVVLRETFYFISPTAQSYDERDGTLLHRGSDIGFSPAWDLAFDLRRHPALRGIPHRGPTLTLSIFADGAGWQGADDESWGIDDLRIAIQQPPSRSAEP